MADDLDKVRLAGVTYESLVNGPGLRRVFYAQGCVHHCPFCQNPDTWDIGTGGKMVNMDLLIGGVLINPMIKGVTFSGGDPFEQAGKFAYMAEQFQKFGYNVWCYTGYNWGQLMYYYRKRKTWRKLIDNCDVIVDGNYDYRKPPIKWAGSSNQRVIDVQASLYFWRVKGTEEIILWEEKDGDN